MEFVIVMEDMKMAQQSDVPVLDWADQIKDGTGKVGTVGFCMGGTLAFLAAAREPLPDASVAFYGFPVPNTTALAPITEASPMEMGPSSFAPAPITHRSAITGTPHRRERPPIVTSCPIDT